MAQPCDIPNSGKAIQAGVVDHRLEVGHPGIERQLLDIPIGKSIAAGVVAQQREISRQIGE